MACDKERLKETVQEIKADRNSYWIGMGDDCEYINYKDKRFDPRTVDPQMKVKDLDHLPKYQADGVIKIYDPIRDRCLYKHIGNHDDYIRLNHSQDIGGYVSTSLGTRFGGYSAMVTLHIDSKDGKNFYVITLATEHGHGGGYYPGYKVNRMMMKSIAKIGDIYAMGHVHEKIIFEDVYLYKPVNSNIIRQKPKVYLVTGTYLRTYPEGVTGYGEKKGYRPTTLGSPAVKFRVRNMMKDGQQYDQLEIRTAA